MTEEWEALKAAGEPYPAKKALATHATRGAFPGCFTKWASARKKFRWDALLQADKARTAKMMEVPNSLKQQVPDLKLKHSNSKFKQSDGARKLPELLLHALEHLLLERIELGEHVTADFAESLVTLYVEQWNQQIDELKAGCAYAFLGVSTQSMDLENTREELPKSTVLK